MLADYTKTSKGQSQLSVLKLVKINVADYTKTRKDECLPITLKLEKMNIG